MNEAEGCFREALEMAHRQNAKSLELRAAMSLHQLLERQGREKEGHRMLNEIYSWFKEGFEMADLQEAKTLLGKAS